MKTVLLTTALLIATSLFAADQPQIANAKVEQRAGVTLEQQVRSTTTPAWIGFAEPVIPGDHTMCCFNSRHDSGQPCCGGCNLEKKAATIEGTTSNCQQLEPSPTFFVFLRVSQ